jgi:isochorismate synthase
VSDILKYRIPGQEKVEQTGTFRALRSMRQANGFFMSTFLKDKLLEFIPSEGSIGKVSFGNEAPYVMERKEYLQEAASFIRSIEKHKLKKAVYSRIKEVDFEEEKIGDLFDALCEIYPKAFVYLVSGELTGTWIGASPETLLQAFSNSGFTMSLAGTKSHLSAAEWGEKEILEQAYVTEFIENRLQNIGVKEIEVSGPYDAEAGPLVHLRTDISFTLENNTVFNIIEKLHPTPAVSGLPQKEAIDLINFREPHERQFYSGMIGFLSRKATSLYVNLRCCQIQKGKAFLYLGGGYTVDSDPVLEWEETETKSKTLINVMQKINF